jgi:hypothetical protein
MVCFRPSRLASLQQPSKKKASVDRKRPFGATALMACFLLQRASRYAANLLIEGSAVYAQGMSSSSRDAGQRLTSRVSTPVK